MPTNEQLNQSFDQDAQILKDKFIDAQIRLMNEFQTEWNRIQAKKGQLAQEVAQDDKLNKKS